MIVAEELFAGNCRTPAGAIEPPPATSAFAVVIVPVSTKGTSHAPLVPPLRVTVIGTGLPPNEAVEVALENVNVTGASGLTAVSVNVEGEPVVAPPAGVKVIAQVPTEAGAVTVTEAGEGVDVPAAKLTLEAPSVQVPVVARVALTAPVVPPVRTRETLVVPPVATEAPELENAIAPGDVALVQVNVKFPEPSPDIAV